jgi:hypothetical protein
MTLFSIFLVCAVGSTKCEKFYSEMLRPPGVSAADVPDSAMLKMCLDNVKEDRSFDSPVKNPKDVLVKITATDCVLSTAPPSDAKAANGFIGYH